MANNFKKYPYQDYNGFNLDWILERVKRADTILEDLDENMQEIIVNQLSEWLDDGTLSDLITSDVLSEISANTAKNAEQDIEIETLTNSVAGLKRWSKVICIGDSIAQGYRPSLGSVTGWCDVLRQKLGLINNSTFFKSVLGQAGFVAAGQGSNFIQLLQALENTVTDKEKVSDIVVIGGINDASLQTSSGAEESAVAAFCTYCHNNYPNALVHVGCIAYYAYTTNVQYLLPIHAGMRSGLRYNAVSIPNILSCMCRFSGYDDSVHVDQEIENKIAETILTGMGRCQLINGTGNINTALVNKHCMPNTMVDGDKLHYWLSAQYVTVTGGATVKGDGTIFKLCDMTETGLMGLGYGDAISNLQTIPFSGDAQRRSDNKYFPCTGVLIPYDGSRFCRVWATDGTNGFVGDLQSFNIYGVAGSLPII